MTWFRKLLVITLSALLFLGVLWLGGYTWDQYRKAIELKNPIDVYEPLIGELENNQYFTGNNTAEAAENDNNETNNGNINQSNSEDPSNNTTEPTKPSESSSEQTTTTEVESTTIESTPEEITTVEPTTVEENSTKENLTFEELDELIASIRKYDGKGQSSSYDRDNFESPIQYYTFNGQKLNRNKYAWHISTHLVSEESFKYNCPYTGLEITDQSKLDFDHIIPLSYVYKYGDIDDWTAEKMNEYAYDQLIGVDVSSSSNRSKGDKGPSDWLPIENIEDYCYTWLVIAQKYNIAMRKEDISICQLEIMNSISSGEKVELINTVIEDCDEYERQQEWMK